jgi:hypothetical protein
LNIREYLCAKYETDWPSTMLGLEARTFRIPYPLKEGWLLAYGDREITPAMRDELIRKLTQSTKSSAYAGLKALGVAPAAEQIELSDTAFYLW